MKFKKYIRTFIIVTIVAVLLTFGVKIVLADYSGSGDPDSGAVSGSVGSGQWTDTKYGYYIKVYNSSGQRRELQTKVHDNDNFAKQWVTSSGSGNSTTYTAHPTVLYDHLNIPYGSTAGNYAQLVSEISVTLEPGDYIIVEPFTKIGPNSDSYVTFRGIVNESTTVSYGGSSCAYYCWYEKPAVILANAAKVGTTITAGANTYTAPTSECTSSNYSGGKFCGYSSTNKFIGYGLVVVRYSDIYPYGTLTITKKDDAGNLLSGAGFTLYSNSSCSTKSKNEQKTGSDGTTTFDNLTPGTTYYYKETTVPNGYVGDTTCHSSGAIVAGQDTKKEVKNDRKGKIKIIKKNNLGTSPENSEAVSGATFKVYRDKRCEGTVVTTITTNTKGEITSGWLTAGTYYLREDPIKNGYHGNPFYKNGTNYTEDKRNDNANGRSNCHQVTVSKGGTTELNIKNKTNCEYEMDKAGLVQGTNYTSDPASKQKLINIYLYLKEEKNNDFRGLLNFSSPKCEAYTPSPALNRSCTSTTIDAGTFNNNDLRNYQKILKVDNLNNKLGQNALCVINYNLYTSFLDEYNKKDDNKIKAGKIMFQDALLGVGYLTEICYTFGLNKNKSFKYDNGSDTYGNYIYENSGLNILNQNLSSAIEVSYNNDSANGKFSKTNTVLYSRTNYIRKFSGLLVNGFKDNEADVNKVNEEGRTCVANGNCIEVSGLDTKYKGYDDYNPYEAIYQFVPIVNITGSYKDLLVGEDGVLNWKTESMCEFKFEPELITYKKEDDKPNYKMNLEFRIIDTHNPFPGKNGTGRVIGANWCKGIDGECTSAIKNGASNQLVDYSTSSTISTDVKEKIINARNSDSTCPRYKITLDSNTVENIRKYNKTHNYSEYNVECKNGKCTNRFLEEFNIKKDEDECNIVEEPEPQIVQPQETSCESLDEEELDTLCQYYIAWVEVPYGIPDPYDNTYNFHINNSGLYEFYSYAGNCNIERSIYAPPPWDGYGTYEQSKQGITFQSPYINHSALYGFSDGDNELENYLTTLNQTIDPQNAYKVRVYLNKGDNIEIKPGNSLIKKDYMYFTASSIEKPTYPLVYCSFCRRNGNGVNLAPWLNLYFYQFGDQTDIESGRTVIKINGSEMISIPGSCEIGVEPTISPEINEIVSDFGGINTTGYRVEKLNNSVENGYVRFIQISAFK